MYIPAVLGLGILGFGIFRLLVLVNCAGHGIHKNKNVTGIYSHSSNKVEGATISKQMHIIIVYALFSIIIHVAYLQSCECEFLA